MNSINILSAIGSTPPPTPSRSRAGSEGDLFGANDANSTSTVKTEDVDSVHSRLLKEEAGMTEVKTEALSNGDDADEKTPLLAQQNSEGPVYGSATSQWRIPRRIASAVVGTIRVVLSAVVAPGRYVIACFYDEDGKFSAAMPVCRVARTFSRKRRRPMEPFAEKTANGANDSAVRDGRRSSTGKPRPKKPQKRSSSFASTSTAMTSDSEFDSEQAASAHEHDGPSKHTRSKSTASSTADEIAPAKRSIRIKLHNEDGLKRKQKRSASSSKTKSSAPDEAAIQAAARAIKSPTSPATSSKLTKFPRAPAPPRPLIPRRQPSYGPGITMSLGPPQKTLVIDLDETLIHSMAKGGRFTTGHMVEVRLQQPVGVGGATIGPQVPILYYVHKRPHCDEFLKKVSKWYKLVVFTAAVQEYADPVIDWLELERKYFSERRYRQHCIVRNGAHIKDLSTVEPDLSKVMIVDNSPLSYAFNPDNAIPIEGWISDPTDNDLLHLIPMLEALQYATDVRAFLALRLGEPQTV